MPQSNSSQQYDVAIVGGGIVGLATCLRLLEQKPTLKIILLEKEDVVAKHQTGNNSGVIHSGIYYKPGSLKAKNCIEGYYELLRFCDKHDIKYDLCGKIIVATSKSELPALENIYNRGIENGLTGLKKLHSSAELKAHEPHVAGLAGLFVPQTGIIDYTDVSLKYAELIVGLGGNIHFNNKVEQIITNSNHSTIVSNQQTIEAKLVINCAGLYADKVAQMSLKPKIDVQIIPFRGEYFELKPEKQYLVKNLIYPVPDANFPFLGVHFTRMVKGGVEAGPNAVLAYAREGYRKSDVNIGEFLEILAWRGFRTVAFKYWQMGLGEFYRSYSKRAFTKALQRLIPEIKANDLVPGGAGVRAQACDRVGGLLDDFSIIENNLQINVLNAPSPAATSSLSIGETVAQMALKRM